MNHMNVKALVSLAIAAIVAVAAAVALNSARKPVTEASREASYLLPALRGHINEVQSLKVIGAEGKVLVALTRGEQGWKVLEKSDYPADTGKLRRLLLSLSDASLREAKTVNEQRYADIGVDDPRGSKEPKGVLLILEGLGKPVELIVGNPSSRGDGTFVRLGGDKQSWLASGELVVDKEASAWLEKDLVDIPVKRVKEVVVSTPSGKSIHLFKNDVEAADFSVANIPKGRELQPGSPQNALAGVLGALLMDDVVALKDAPARVASESVTARFLTVDGLALTLDAWQIDDKSYVILKAAVDRPAAEAAAAAAESKEKAKQPADGGSPKGGEPAANPDAPGATGSAPPISREPRLADLDAEVAKLNARFADRVFVLPSARFQDIDSDIEKFLKPREPAAAAAGKKTAPKPAK